VLLRISITFNGISYGIGSSPPFVFLGFPKTPIRIDAEVRCSGFLIRCRDRNTLPIQEFDEPDAVAQKSGYDAMAAQAEGADVGEVAFATAFDDGHDVIGVPERFARTSAEAPMREERGAAGPSGEAQLAGSSDGVDAAIGADAAIALEYLFANIGGLGAELPLVNAELRAKREAAPRDFEGTPAAEAATIGAAWDEFAVDPTALHGPHGAHKLFLNRAVEFAGDYNNAQYKV
jgi:hypothetical protein